MTEEAAEGQWILRDGELKVEMEGRIRFYSHWCEVNRKGQRITSVVVLLCSALAPVAVISKPGFGFGVFGLSEVMINQLSLTITLTLAIAEGIRRIFRFEQRWTICANCREELRSVRAEYLEAQIGKAIGSDDWIHNLMLARQMCQSITLTHISDFAQMLKGGEEALKTAKKSFVRKASAR